MSSKAPTQKEEILDFMRQFGWITPMHAFQEIGCTKLATRIGELIRAGYKIEKQVYHYKNWRGQPRHFTRYRLVV